jgi:E3 ubiquitin-protein ligase RNF38/44
MLRGAGHSHEEVPRITILKGLQDQEFKDLNQVNYRPTENLSEENKKCIICMTEYEPNEALKLLPCTHRFHAQCIEQWLKDHSKCPICKKDARTRN